MRNHLSLALTLVCALFVAPGCSSSDSDASACVEKAGPASEAAVAGTAGYAEQCEVLLDGQVTETEYVQMLELTRDCFADYGVQMTIDSLPSPIDGLLRAVEITSTGSDEDFNAATVACEHKYVSFVTDNYLAARDQTMNPDLVAASVACLSAHGFTVKDDVTNLNGFIAGKNPPGKPEVEKCVSQGIEELWPDWDVPHEFAW